MPDRPDHFAEGADARLAGALCDANPYDVDNDWDAYADWNDGWNSIDEDTDDH